MSQMLPKRPYLLRAMHQWITDCGNTPHVIVDAGREGVEVPRAYVKDGKIVLNLSDGATQHLHLGARRGGVRCALRGVIHHVRFPRERGARHLRARDRRGHGVLRAGPGRRSRRRSRPQTEEAGTAAPAAEGRQVSAHLRVCRAQDLDAPADTGPAAIRKEKSRPVSRVLSRAIIPLGSASPRTSSGLPGSARGSTLPRTVEGRSGFPIWPCSRWGLPCRRVLPPTRCALTAPFHPCRSREGLRRFALCCTFRGLAPPRRYLAPDPPEPGLSSTPSLR